MRCGMTDLLLSCVIALAVSVSFLSSHAKVSGIIGEHAPVEFGKGAIKSEE
jgi:hypothetical protein